MDTNFKIIFQPQPGPQTDFIRCPVFEIFYGGARGGGKSSHRTRIGYDVGNKIKAKKRHVLLDTVCLLIQAIVQPADIQNR